MELLKTVTGKVVSGAVALAVVAALQFSSALAIYWATSNTFSAIQTVVLHRVVRRRARSGATDL